MSTQEVGGHGQHQISEKVVMREKSKVAKGKVQFTGKDILVVLRGEHLVPEKIEMREKMDLLKLKLKFGAEAIVYLVNKNLQDLPRRMAGSQPKSTS
jgi:hypothetical protein